MPKKTPSILVEQYQSFLTPLFNANKLAVLNLEKLIDFQTNAFRSYVDLGLSQLKEASEITDPKSLQAYLGRQVEIANLVRQKLLDDAKALTDLNAGFKAEFDKLAQDSMGKAAEQTAKSAPQITEKTAEAAEGNVPQTA